MAAVAETFDALIPPVFGLVAFLYLGLAVYVSRSSPQSIIGFFLLLLGMLVASTAFSHGTEDANMFGIGRVLGYFSSSFIPVAFYAVYRHYTVGPAPIPVMLMLSLVPALTTLLVLTNAWHNMIWWVVETDGGWRFSYATESLWFKRVHGPYSYGLFAYSALALAARLDSIAPAHRRIVTLMLVCAVLPFLLSFANNILGIGTQGFPVTSGSLVAMFPMYAYISLSLRVFEFSPLAYPTLFDHVRDPIVVLDNDQRIVCANRRASEMLGRSERELLGHRLWEDFPEARAILHQAKDLDLTQTLKLKTDQVYEVSVAPLLDRHEHQTGIVVVCRDVTQRRKAQAQLADSEHLIRTLIETSSNGILRFSRDAQKSGVDSRGNSATDSTGDAAGGFRCVFANRAAEKYLAAEGDTLVGMPLEALEALEPGRMLKKFERPGNAKRTVSFETSTTTAEGERWLRIVAESVGADFSVTLIDITQRKRNEDKMLADALRDPLTGVLNRRGFESEGRNSIRASDTGAVLYLDLNDFKKINDRFGHQAGDALLKAFGHRLQYCLRPEDVLGRLGGDEFTIVLPGVSVEDAKHVAERLVTTASEAYIIQGQEINCTASVGIALMPQHGEELWHLVSVADQAMYNAKSMQQDAANDRASYIEAAIAS